MQVVFLILSGLLLTACGGGSSSVAVDDNGAVQAPSAAAAEDSAGDSDSDSETDSDTDSDGDSDGDTNSETATAAIDIYEKIFTARSADCADYSDSYSASVRDLTRLQGFDSEVTVTADEGSCTITSDNIPNHDFNDSSANFRADVVKQSNQFVFSRRPLKATQNDALSAQMWDAVMLNGVVVDIKTGGCYYPSERRADADGNTEAGCPNGGINWQLVALEYATKFGVDQHNAHVQPDSGSYHYHGDPNALFDDVPVGDGSPVIGFAADGFPIYGSYIFDQLTGAFRKATSGYTLRQGSRGTRSDSNPGGDFNGIYEQDWEWTDAGDLDECNGMIYQGQYGYYVTESYPFMISCYVGTVSQTFRK